MGAREVSPVQFFGGAKPGALASGDKVVRDLGPTVMPSADDDDGPHYHGQVTQHGLEVKSAKDAVRAQEALEGSSSTPAGSDDDSTRPGEAPFIDLAGNGLAP